MKIVVDSNRVFSAFIKAGVTRRILFTTNNEFFAPEELLGEIGKYKGYIIKKGNLNEEKFEELYLKLVTTVKFLSTDTYKEHFSKALEVMKDIDRKDAPFLAIGLAINADGIWTGDPHLRQQNLVRVFSIKDLMIDL